MVEQEQQCVFCLIAQNKIPSAKVYDDEELSVFLDIRPATQGHMQVIPKTHAPLFSMLNPETKNKIFNIALSIGSNLVKKLGASGVTYLINEGQGAGQKISHASMHIIPRYSGDNVSIGWEEKDWSQEEINKYLNETLGKLQSKQPEEASSETKTEEEEASPSSSEKTEKKEKEEVVEIPERIPRYW